MRTVLQVSLLAFCLALSAAEHSKGLLSRSADLSLMQFMMNTRDLSGGNSARSMECFTYYVPVLNDITAEYEASWARCIATAEEQRGGIDERTQSDRFQIESAANNSCDLMSACSQLKDAISYFECYTGAGSENSKTMYTISANSSSVLAQVREEYRLIENDQNRCTDKSDRVYVEDTANTYEEMQNCLQGKSPVPKPTTPSTTTTDAPTESSAPTAPPTESSAPTEPPTETTAPTAPPTESSVPTEPPTESSAPTEPPTESSVPTEPPTESSAPTEPPTESSPPSEPPTESTPDVPTEPTTDAPTEPTTDAPTEPNSSEETDVQKRSQNRINKFLEDLRNRVKK